MPWPTEPYKTIHLTFFAQTNSFSSSAAATGDAHLELFAARLWHLWETHICGRGRCFNEV